MILFITPKMCYDFIMFFRHIRILGISSFDLIIVLLIIHCISDEYKRKNYWQSFFGLFVISLGIAVIVHYILGVNTQLNYWLGLTKCLPDYDSLTGIFTC